MRKTRETDQAADAELEWSEVLQEPFLAPIRNYVAPGNIGTNRAGDFKKDQPMALLKNLVVEYLGGILALRQALTGMTHAQVVSRPVAGKWSTLEVVCHLADDEVVYVDRMKRIIAEDHPTLPVADPKQFSISLAYQDRDLEEELAVIEAVRRQMSRILRSVQPDALTRTGVHSTEGLCTVEQVLSKAIIHLNHHLKFIIEKRLALGLAERQVEVRP